MRRVAIVGAGGFIGGRAVEMLDEHDQFEVVPVARRPLPRFATGVVADALDRSQLEAAFQGCEAVVSSISGPPSAITGVCQPIVDAAAASGVRRIVHLSSQAVHGQALAEGTREDTPFPGEQAFPYNEAKAEAETLMTALTADAGIDLVILRPGIVYGPQSRWTAGIADELLSGEAFLIRDAEGACNAIYVDNLVDAIALSLSSDAPIGETMFVNDAETLRWAELIEPIANALGLHAIRRPSLDETLKPAPSGMLAAFRRLGRRTLPYSREMALLQSNAVHTSNAKAERLLGYRPPVTHAEGMRRSIAWLAAQGYPVR